MAATGRRDFSKGSSKDRDTRIYPSVPVFLAVLWDENVADWENFERAWRDSLTFRSHFGDLQWWHAMFAGEINGQQWRNKIVGRAIRNARDAAATRRPERKGKLLGQVLHTIQDSYARGHVQRDVNLFYILRVQDYNAQKNKKLHRIMDNMEGSPEYYRAARASTLYLDLVLCREPLDIDAQVQRLFESIILPFGGGTPVMGGAAPGF